MGQYDAVAKVDFPDDYTVATFTLAAAKSGNQKNATMRAVNEIVEKIP